MIRKNIYKKTINNNSNNKCKAKEAKADKAAKEVNSKCPLAATLNKIKRIFALLK